MSTRTRDKKGIYRSTNNPIEDAAGRIKEVEHEQGYTFKEQMDYNAEMVHVLEKSGLKDPNEKTDPFGFGEDFYRFLGVGTRYNSMEYRNYRYDLPIEKMDMLQGDAKNYFTPIDNFYSNPTGSDTAYDSGRIPVNHLMVLASQRLGIVFRACNGSASDVFRNKFDFVEYEDIEKPVDKPEILSWMRETYFWDKWVDILDFEQRSGLGHIVSYYPNERGVDKIMLKAPSSRPNEFDSFSAYMMTPLNIITEETKLDYDKQKWDFLGGIIKPRQIHRSRVYVLETRRVEGGLRGIALAELCWTPLMCYLNTMYYVLKSLARLGTVIASIHTEREYPTPTETQAYIDVWNLQKANDLFVLGKNATFELQNTAGKIGSGLETYLEFLREDISAAWIFPKNQLFGRADGGGLSGAGSLVSKEDYLGSNISVKQLKITNDVLYFLDKVCGFPNMSKLSLRWNLDLHKTEEQRLKERAMREQVKQQEIMTKQAKLGFKLYRQQVKLQLEMNEVQMKMIKEDPEGFMMGTEKDEENRGDESGPNKAESGDFVRKQEYLQVKYRILKKQFKENTELLKALDTIKPVV